MIGAIRAGERVMKSAAWARLIERHQDRLYAMCVRMVHDRDLAEDLTHDAFIKIIQGIESFDGRARLTTWMTRIAMNVCLSKLRSEKVRRHASLDALRAPPDGGPRPGSGRGRIGGSGGGKGGRGMDFEQNRELGGDDRVEAIEERDLLLEALRLIDGDQRQVLILADQRQLGYDEIAEVLGVAVGTVKSRVFRARAALREMIESLAAERTAAAKRGGGGSGATSCDGAADER